MPHHADDFGLHIELLQMDALPDGIFMREPGARKNVIDVDDHGAFSLSCGVTKRPRSSVIPMACCETGFNQIKHGLMHVVVVGGLRAGLRSRRVRTSHGSSGASRA